jgi:GMP synthase (glutamine-hydrolysing)
MTTSTPERRRALLLQHERDTPGGLIREWLDEHGVDVDEVRIDLDDRDLDPCEYQLIVSLGSESAAYDDSLPFISREQKLLRQAIAASVPVLGICFGAQLLARALGGAVFRAPVPEIGWFSVRTHDPGLVEEGPWFQWHFDTFTPPPGSRLIAESDAGPQAYVLGRSFGVQFHPEVTPEIIDGWVAASRHELEASGVDPDALRREAKQRAVEKRGATWRLLAHYTELVARLGWGGTIPFQRDDEPVSRDAQGDLAAGAKEMTAGPAATEGQSQV